ncbi:MAG TPA: hypothetical protein DD451_04485 [Candidatus Moranbacteria bacterium]|nr:hypothetical protein [Candidatus Moranbacteria bacterium]
MNIFIRFFENNIKAMVNINLHREEKKENRIYELNFWRSGTFFSITLLIVTSFIYAGQLLYKKKLVSNENAIIKEISEKKSSLGSAALVSIKDFDQRISKIDNNLAQRVYPNDVLAYIEDFLVKNVYIDSYKYEDSKQEVALNVIADSYNAIASQILNFKKSDKFSNVDISSTNRTEEGKITFTLTMILSNYNNPENNL